MGELNREQERHKEQMEVEKRGKRRERPDVQGMGKRI